MKELRILLITLCIINIATVNMIALASTDTRLDSESHESDDDQHEEQNEKKKEIIKKQKEQLSKFAKIAKLKKKTLPITPVKPTKPTITKPVTPVISSITKSSTVNYRTPAGNVPVLFTVTTKNGVIISALSVTKAQDSTSISYQNSFASKISQSVVGKKIAGLNLSAIGGASLTTVAFEQFVKQSF